MIRRRDFVLGCGSLAVMSGIPIVNAAEILATPASGKAGRFRPLINTFFRAANAAGQSLELELVAIEETHLDPRLEQFRLVFASGTGAAEDGIYELAHCGDFSFATETVNIETSPSDPTGRTLLARYCLFAA